MTGRIDVVTIFPDFFSALDISLIGKARTAGTLETQVHDLRQWTTDRHRTVDDTPAGGGAGMVMRPDVWGAALDDVIGDAARSTLIIPTPGGQPFTQRLAEDLAREVADGGRLVIACGRYEGIDSRVADHYASRMPVLEVSIGDYVLNGGETAAMVMIEAVGRLVPGVVGNPDSLLEESHGEAGLLEYPVYTRPTTWRGLDIPEVLRSGDHARIAQWRREQALQRTARVRPDLLTAPPVVRRARAGDAPRLHEIAGFTFHLACPPDFPREQASAFVAENLSESQFRAWAKSRNAVLLVAEVAGAAVGYATLLLRDTSPDRPDQDRARTACVSKLYVLPEHHGRKIADALMEHSLDAARDAGMERVWLGVNQENRRAQAFYRKYGFENVATRFFDVGGQQQADFVMERTLDFAPAP